MFKQLRVLALLLMPIIAVGQKASEVNAYKKIVSNYLSEKKSEWKLTDKDITDWSVSSCYTNPKSGVTYFYLHQEVNGIRIFTAVSAISIKDGKVQTFSKRIFPDAASRVNTGQTAFTPLKAIDFAAQHLEISQYSAPKFISADRSLNRSYYTSDLSTEKIRVDLVYQQVNEKFRLAYDVNVRLKSKNHWWNMRIDAIDGKLLSKNDWTTSCDFDAPGSSASAGNFTNTNSSVNPNSGSQHNALAASYRVFALPLEAPNFGASTLVPDPADPIASPFGWHDTDGITGPEFTITRGNNVYAYDDIANIDAPGTSPNGTATLTFDYPINFTQQPGTYLDASNTNLFYVNNMVHDILSHYGFDEVSGNFQEKNYSGNGAGNDYVVAECQDGGGTNNANFSTPDDGQNGWMQMYLWSGGANGFFIVNSPAPIAGNYACVEATFGPGISSPITEDVVIANDGSGTTTDACSPLTNGSAMAGKIALIDRGTCNFADKVLAAQNAGAIAVLVANNSGGAPFAMGGNANSGLVNIPSVMISQANGTMIKNSINGGATVNVTLDPASSVSVDLDGSLDNGIVLHEFGHGVSNRLTGGPLNSNCLFNSEQGGEGWSDYFSLLFTMKPGDAGPDSRGIGTFALGEPSTGDGIRRFPYSTNMGVNPLTYSDVAVNNEVHDVGEVWCVTLWDMTWNLIDQYGFDGDWINGQDSAGNHIALSLVIEGMKLQPCNPGFLDGRDAILLADDNLYGGVHKCLIWDAFAKRGMGFDAIQGTSETGDETEGFALPPICMIPTAPPVADFNTATTTSCFGVIRFTDMSTSTPQGWNWNFGDGGSSTIQNPTHTYTAPGVYTVTLIVTNTLGTDTMIRNNYINITTPAAPAVTGDTTICSGFSTVLTAAINPGNICEWRDQNDSVLFTGTVFNTPTLNTNTTYQVVQYAPTIIQHVGPLDNTIGTGGYHNSSFEGKLFFTTNSPVRLISFWVDANGSGLRNINLFQNGTLLQFVQLNIPDGQSRIIVNMDIPNPGNYELGVSNNNNLYRNQSGANYPYNISGLVSITGCNAINNPTLFYYYLYDWEVQELPCTSSPQPVNVDVNSQLSSFTFVDNALTVTFNSTGAGAVSWAWDFGNGMTSNQQGATITYATPGNYTVSLTTTDANGCQSVTAHIITVTLTDIAQIDDKNVTVVYDEGKIKVRFNSPAEHAVIRVYDAIGKIVIDESFNNGLTYEIPDNFSSEFLMVNVEEKSKSYSKKIVLVK